MDKEQALQEIINATKMAAAAAGISIIIIGAADTGKELITSGITAGKIADLSIAVLGGLKKDPGLFKIIANATDAYNRE